MQRIIKTDRLILKTLDESAAEDVSEYYQRNRDFLEEWEPKRESVFYTKAHQKKELAFEQQEMDAGRMLRFWIYRKDDSNKIIGTFSFGSIVRGVFQSCFLGYKLDKDELNNGYMTEAIRAGIKVIFEDYGLHRIEANIMPRNKRSLRVADCSLLYTLSIFIAPNIPGIAMD